MARDFRNDWYRYDRGERGWPPVSLILSSPKTYFYEVHEGVRFNLRDPHSRIPTVGLLVVASLALILLVYWITLVAGIPSVSKLRDARFAESSIVYSVDGIELARYADENRTWVDLDQISPNVVNALLATEDHRFYQHWGIDLRRTLSSIYQTLSGDTQGGSTLTMQFARNAFPDLQDDWDITRKIKEWIIALQLEGMYTKDEILEMYLNTVPMMYNTFGIEAASDVYFNKTASELDLIEAATLVGMLKGTVLYNPVRNPEQSHERRNTVLQQMVKHGYLEPERYEELAEQPTPLDFRRTSHNDNKAPYFVEYLRIWLSDWAEEHDHNLYRDGLRIYTTLDSQMQQAADSAVREIGEGLQAVADVEWSRRRPPFVSAQPEAYKTYRDRIEPFAYYWESQPEMLDRFIQTTDRYKQLADSLDEETALTQLRSDQEFVDSVKTAQQRIQAGFVAIDPKTGHVKAWVGGRNFAEDKYDRVAMAKRQPGSTFKPFVYAAAIEEGFSPEDMMRDEVFEYVDRHTGKRWKPLNVGNATGEPITLRDALAYSKNTVTAQVIASIGPEKVVDVAQHAGIKSDLQAVPSLGLGTSEVNLIELVAAYGTFASNGIYREPVVVTRIEDREGAVLATFDSQPEEAISPSTAYTVLDMMRGVVDYGTGVRIRSFGARGDLAGKTGTTQGGADGWFVLLHPDLVMGSWVGFNSMSVSLRSDYWGQGAHNALYVVGEFIREAGLRPGRFEEPPGYYVPRPGKVDTKYITEPMEDGEPKKVEALFGEDFDEDDLADLRDLEEISSDNEEEDPEDESEEENLKDEDADEQDEDEDEQVQDENDEDRETVEELNRRARDRSRVNDYLDRLERNE